MRREVNPSGLWWAIVALTFVPFVRSWAQSPEQPQAVDAEPLALHACYVPVTGLVYRIKEPGLPSSCFSTKHVEFSWASDTSPGSGSEGVPGPTGPQGPPGPTGPPGSPGPAPTR